MQNQKVVVTGDYDFGTGRHRGLQVLVVLLVTAVCDLESGFQRDRRIRDQCNYNVSVSSLIRKFRTAQHGALALALEPDIMLFDEPASALDPETIGEVLDAMKRLAEEGMTMLVVTHEMNLARRVANNVVVFERGRIIEQGPPLRIFDAPQAERTRDFLSHLGWEG
jgi:ABC-type histidine transport system ATPase subunit